MFFGLQLVNTLMGIFFICVFFCDNYFSLKSYFVLLVVSIHESPLNHLLLIESQCCIDMLLLY